MKPRERFVAALRCGIPDRVPVYDFVGSRRLQQQLLGYATDLYEAETQAKLAGLLGFDAFPVFLGGFCGVEDEPHAAGSKYEDEWGVTYVKHGWPIMTQTTAPIKSRSDWINYKMPDVSAPRRTRMIREAVQCNRDELAILVVVLGPLTMANFYLMDPATLATTLYDDPGLVHECAGLTPPGPSRPCALPCPPDQSTRFISPTTGAAERGCSCRPNTCANSSSNRTATSSTKCAALARR